MKNVWQQGSILDVTITDLNSQGEGVGRWQDRVIFVPDTVPGDNIQTRLVQVKPTYAHGKLLEVITASPQRVRPACIVADKCGGCQWQSLTYGAQLAAKTQQVEDALTRIGGFADAPVRPILAAEASLGYRNKATYPLTRSATGQIKAGYYRKGSHQVVNLNQCPVQDERLNPLLAGMKQDIQAQGWSVYDEGKHRGRLRHLSLRIGRRTGQMLATLVSATPSLPNLAEQAERWLTDYPDLVGVALNHNPQPGNRIFGPDTPFVAGQAYLEEVLAGVTFRIQPTTFFQVHTEQAERLLMAIQAELNLQGTEVVVDAFCGVGALILPLAHQIQLGLGIESHTASVEQARHNATLNGIHQVTFAQGTVEAVLPTVSTLLGQNPDVVLLDPPRKGCAPAVLAALLDLAPSRIVYVSCNPATLARDLAQLCQNGAYRLTAVQPVDFFPQTPHVECAAFLVR